MSWWPYLAEGCCVAVVWLLILYELANYNRIVHQLGEKQLATVSTNSLVNVIFDKYHVEFQHTFTQAI